MKVSSNIGTSLTKNIPPVGPYSNYPYAQGPMVILGVSVLVTSLSSFILVTSPQSQVAKLARSSRLVHFRVGDGEKREGEGVPPRVSHHHRVQHVRQREQRRAPQRVT